MGNKNSSETLADERQNMRNQLADLRNKMQAGIADKEKALEAVKSQRKAAFNPYADATNKFANLTNEFANLGVATKAAEFQAEQTDIALANPLDTMQATGAGAGGATALAQAALKSKRGISASLQQQEAANQKAAAQGAMNVQKAKAQGEDNLQRQKAEGEKYKFSIEEQRTNADLNRAAKDLDNQRARVDAAQASLLQLDLSSV